jgi:diguanylate cyclase (GGDEF)-like protein
MVLIGCIAGLVHFKPAVALPFVIANSATNYAIRGIKLVFKGLVAFSASAVIAFFIFGGTFDPTTRPVEMLPAFAYLVLATHYIGYISYVRGLALMRAKRNAEELAFRDGLTGVASRRSFDAALTEEWNRALRTGSWLSVVLLDIDYFKAYNDHYGHPAGDDCLKLVAQRISDLVCRPGDLLGRYGGEEFGLVLPGSDPAGAMTFAQKVLTGVREMQIEHLDSEVAPIVTVSIGVSTMVPLGSFSPRGLILTADQALYRAKEEGRNQIRENNPAATETLTTASADPTADPDQSEVVG